VTIIKADEERGGIMKAAQINEYGGPSVVQINEVDQPAPVGDQILVEVHASSLNPFDTKVREGLMKEMIPLQFPATLGGDIAGIVAKIGEDVNGLAIGDKVYGQANVVAGNSGAFAEFAVTKANEVAKMPKDLSFDQAASLPLVGVSAWQALTQHIKLQPGQKLFIHGGAGGIGSIAIQIAKHIGAYVATTATGEGVVRVKELGADEVIDYKKQDFVEVLHDFDAVFDTVGGDDFNRSLTILKQGGVAISMTAKADDILTRKHAVTTITQSTHVTTEALNELRKLVEVDVVTPQVGKTFSLDQIHDAFEVRESGAIQGKVVIEMKQS
jgi:NADPH:quinone reductase-like Zn-dependent oxidoreductase